MTELNENLPDPKRIEKELGEFLNKKFGGNVKIISPSLQPKEEPVSGRDKHDGKKKLLEFNLKPAELISYLDQYIVKQEKAKSVLATKICTHFNRIKFTSTNPEEAAPITGNIKANILMLGPTGVGKTYIVKLIAKKIGVPFVKADATKFSETGYVGGDIEDLVRDLVKEADDDIGLAECGIIYIDEIDKIAATPNLVGSDISRTGVQRALLKPMEETDVDLKVPHDPVSMMQELESYQRTGKRSQRRVNTANILFIVSGAFGDLAEIVSKRISTSTMGFGAVPRTSRKDAGLLNKVKAEDLVEFGFESEFIGRLPVRCILSPLSEDDLYAILKMPNNPVILGKRLDFAAYGIEIVFSDEALRTFARRAFMENTGARGLVSVVEDALIGFEEKLPSTAIDFFPVTREVLEHPEESLSDMISMENMEKWRISFDLVQNEHNQYITDYISDNWKHLTLRHGLTLSKERGRLVADYFSTHVSELGHAIKTVKSYYEDVKKIEGDFFSRYDLNIIFEEDAVDFLIEQFINHPVTSKDIMFKIHDEFFDGLKLVQEKTGKNRFFISQNAFRDPKGFLDALIRKEIK